MKIINHITLSKQIVIKKLQSIKANKCEVWDLTLSQDRKDLLNELEKMMKNGSISVIVVEGDR
jgi:nucleoside diphosphate kinase